MESSVYGLVVHSSSLTHEYWLSSLFPIKMTFISGIYCYALIGVFFAKNCETKTITKDKWVHNTAGIRFDDSDVQSPLLRLRREEKTLGDSCVSDEDCNKHIDNSVCRLSTCDCRANFTRNAIKNVDSDSRILLCYKFNNSYVNDVAVDNNNNNTTRSPSSPEKFESSTMLPIMIVLGIMFIGMCVALNLFSRAQFRNSRSLFTSNSHVVNKAGSRSASHRRTSYPTLPVGSASQHRLNSVGSGSGNESPTQALRTSTHSQLTDSHLRNQRLTRVNDDCISSTTVANVNLTITNEVNGASFASEIASQMHH